MHRDLKPLGARGARPAMWHRVPGTRRNWIRLLGQKLEGLICHSQESGFYPGGDLRALCKDVVGSFLYQKDHSTNSTEKELKERTHE